LLIYQYRSLFLHNNLDNWVFHLIALIWINFPLDDECAHCWMNLGFHKCKICLIVITSHSICFWVHESNVQGSFVKFVQLGRVMVMDTLILQTVFRMIRCEISFRKDHKIDYVNLYLLCKIARTRSSIREIDRSWVHTNLLWF